MKLWVQLFVGAVACAWSTCVAVQRERPHTPRISELVASGWTRSAQDAYFHGEWLDTRYPVARHDRWLHRSTFMMHPVGLMDDIEEAVEGLRQRPDVAEKLDRRLMTVVNQIFAQQPGEIWALKTRVQLWEDPESAEPLLRELELAWPSVERLVRGENLPLWAIGRLRDYFMARSAIDALSVASHAGRLAAGRRDVEAHRRWDARYEALSVRVAAIPEDTWEGTSPLENSTYSQMVRIIKRRWEQSPLGRGEVMTP